MKIKDIKEKLKHIFSKEKLLNKKFIIGGIIIIIIVTGGVTYKINADKKTLAAQSNVKYTVLSKTNIVKSLSTSGTVKTNSYTNVYSNSTAKVKTVNASAGDKVKAGDVLAVLDTYTLEQDIAKLQETIKNTNASAQNKLENAKRTYEDAKYLYDNKLNTDIINAEADVNSNKLSFEDKQRTYEYNKVMFDNGEISKNDLNKAQNDYDNAKASYDKSTVALESKKVTVKQSLEKAKNDYEDAQISANDKSNQISLENKQKDLANCTIVAPVDGTVTSVNATEGSSSNGALFKIENLDDLVISVSIEEVDVPKVKIGQKAKITTDATGKEDITGEVMSIDPVSSNSSTSSSSSSSSS